MEREQQVRLPWNTIVSVASYLGIGKIVMDINPQKVSGELGFGINLLSPWDLS